MKAGHVAGAVAGVLLIAVGFGADMMGLGPNPGMGWKQISLMAAGALVLGASLYLGKSQD